MGHGGYDSATYASAATLRASKGIDDFDYSRKTMASGDLKVHESLDPLKIDGKRESRDSAEHPNSLPIFVPFDVTGSMGGIPVVLQKKLNNLMAMIIAKGGVDDPQICVGAVGDYHSDELPFQVGQFESDNRIDEQLRSIVLEGRGGSQTMESYGLAYYFLARKTVSDAWDKRGVKGFAFTIGDETPHMVLSPKEIKDVFGDVVQGDINVADLIMECQEKWEVFHLLPSTHTGKLPQVQRGWNQLLGERVLKLDDPALVTETIAAAIAVTVNSSDIADVIDTLGLDDSAAAGVSSALVPFTSKRSSVPANRATVSGGLPVPSGSAATRL